MTVASIDIGSNTVLMLISEINFEKGTFSALANFYRTPRIGQDVIKTGKILDEKVEALLGTLAEYRELIGQYGCSRVFVNATNALRIASNGEDIAAAINERFEWKVNIIEGTEEARLSFLGAAFPFVKDENKVVIDIGGGSTEIIWGNRNSILYRKSFSIGVVSLKDIFIKHVPPSKKEISDMTEFADCTFSKLRENVTDDCEMIAVAGTPTTLACIKNNLRDYSENVVHNSSLSCLEIDEISAELSGLKDNEILERYGSVVAGRENVLLAGCIILTSAMKNLGSEIITVSTRGLRYGPVVEFLAGYNTKGT